MQMRSAHSRMSLADILCHVDAEMQNRTIKMFRNIRSKVMDSNFLKLLLLVFNRSGSLISCLRILVVFILS